MEGRPNSVDEAMKSDYWGLMSCACSGTLSSADRARLDAILAADQVARQTYGLYMLMHGELTWYFCGDAADNEETATALTLPMLADEDHVPPPPVDSRSTLGRPWAAVLFDRGATAIFYAAFALLMAIAIVAAVAWSPAARPQHFVHGAVVAPSPGARPRPAVPGSAADEKMSGEPRIDPYSHE
jgi:hypothetical protein